MLFQVVWKTIKTLCCYLSQTTLVNIRMSQPGKEDPLRIHREGLALYDGGKYGEAIDKFLQASQLYEKVGNFFDASYMLFKAAECSFLLKEYEIAIERFMKAADIALGKGYDRFGLGALEYARDCYKAMNKEKSKEFTDLLKRVDEVKKKLEAQAF
jgi:tetratricopeptide (TPR) repeat protein